MKWCVPAQNARRCLSRLGAGGLRLWNFIWFWRGMPAPFLTCVHVERVCQCADVTPALATPATIVHEAEREGSCNVNGRVRERALRGLAGLRRLHTSVRRAHLHVSRLVFVQEWRSTLQ
jgi:hypothetical protein